MDLNGEHTTLHEYSCEPDLVNGNSYYDILKYNFSQYAQKKDEIDAWRIITRYFHTYLLEEQSFPGEGLEPLKGCSVEQ